MKATSRKDLRLRKMKIRPLRAIVRRWHHTDIFMMVLPEVQINERHLRLGITEHGELKAVDYAYWLANTCQTQSRQTDIAKQFAATASRKGYAVDIQASGYKKIVPNEFLSLTLD